MLNFYDAAKKIIVGGFTYMVGDRVFAAVEDAVPQLPDGSAHAATVAATAYVVCEY